jgi:hypothetical protein
LPCERLHVKRRPARRASDLTSTPSTTQDVNMPAISYNDSQWQSRGDMELQISADGESAALHSRARQDWWRTPPHSEPESDVDRCG